MGCRYSGGWVVMPQSLQSLLDREDRACRRPLQLASLCQTSPWVVANTVSFAVRGHSKRCCCISVNALSRRPSVRCQAPSRSACTVLSNSMISSSSNVRCLSCWFFSLSCMISSSNSLICVCKRSFASDCSACLCLMARLSMAFHLFPKRNAAAATRA